MVIRDDMYYVRKDGYCRKCGEKRIKERPFLDEEEIIDFQQNQAVYYPHELPF